MRAAVRSALLASALLCALGGAAQAQWELENGVDPMTDERTGFMSVDSPDNAYALVMKCWADPEQTCWIALMLDVPFDRAGGYPDRADVPIRIDARPVLTAPFGKVNIANKVAYVTGPEFGDRYAVLEAALLGARARVAAEILLTQVVFDVPNTGAAARSMRSTCRYLPQPR